jgi:hypothetical protein
MLTRKIVRHWLLAAALVLATSAAAKEERAFNHPGVFSRQEDLAGLARRVAAEPAAKLGYEQLRRSAYADLARPAAPFPVVFVAAAAGNKYEEALRGDAHAAYATALMWVITRDGRYRDKAISILDGWAATFTSLQTQAGAASQIELEAAWAAPIWIAAADIIRYYDRGAARWQPARVAAFDGFLNKLIRVARGARTKDNNWGTSANLALLAAAVYQNDLAAYQEAIALHKIHLTSISKKTGALGPDYLRDPWHPQYTVLTWIQTCEIAWNQGDDLYGLTLDGQSLPRLAICLEHFSQLFSGQLPDPAGLRVGHYKDSQKKRQGYDMAFNHFIRRKGMAAKLPAFAKMVPAWRPGGQDGHFVAWDTLTHGELGH